MDEEKSGSSTLQKNMICYTVGLAVRISGYYHADFHEGHGTIGAGQGRGVTCVN